MMLRHPLVYHGRLGLPQAGEGPQLFLVQPSDALNMNDSQWKLRGMGIPEAEAFADGAARSITKRLIDAVDTSDTFARILLRVLGLGDSVTASDDLARTLSSIIGDQAAVTDAQSKTLLKNLVDQALATDAAALTIGRVLLAADSLQIGDDFRKMLAKIAGDNSGVVDAYGSLLNKILGDRQDVSDAVSVNAIVGLIVLAVADSLALSDDQRKTLLKNVGDVGGVAESISSLLRKSLADQQDVLDAAALVRGIFRTLSDSLEVSDAVVASLIRVLVAADSVPLTDGFSKMLAKAVSDNAGFRDEFVKSLSKTLSENAEARDAYCQSLNKVLSESQDISDSPALVRYLRRLMSDSLALSDQASTSKIISQLIVEVLETQDVSDALVKQLFKGVAENQGINDIAAISGVVILRHYIESLIASGQSLMGITAGHGQPTRIAASDGEDKRAWANKPGIQMVAGDDEALDNTAGTKGRRDK